MDNVKMCDRCDEPLFDGKGKHLCEDLCYECEQGIVPGDFIVLRAVDVNPGYVDVRNVHVECADYCNECSPDDDEHN